MRYATEAGFTLCGLDYSPIRGPEGNIEYLLYLSASGTTEPEKDSPLSDADYVTDVVGNAHAEHTT